MSTPPPAGRVPSAGAEGSRPSHDAWNEEPGDGVTSLEVLRRRAALTELGSAVRALTHAVVDTEVDDAVLAEAADLARRATDLLTARTRPANRLSPAEDLRLGRRLFSPVVGAGNAVSPPLTIVRTDTVALRLEAACTLHRVHEGPPTYGHGGVTAMILDQVLGHVVMLTGGLGLTRSLTLRYRRPVPLGVPLVVTAAAGGREGSRIEARGVIATQAAPGVALVEADGVFVVPNADQVARIFGHVERLPGETVPTGD
jgi:hypothetical protein